MTGRKDEYEGPYRDDRHLDRDSKWRVKLIRWLGMTAYLAALEWDPSFCADTNRASRSIWDVSWLGGYMTAGGWKMMDGKSEAFTALTGV